MNEISGAFAYCFRYVGIYYQKDFVEKLAATSMAAFLLIPTCTLMCGKGNAALKKYLFTLKRLTWARMKLMKASN